MQRFDAPEILDSDTCSPCDAHAVLRVLGRINRWFGGVSTTRKMIERAAQATGEKSFSLLEVAAGLGEVPAIVQRKVARRGITLDVTLLDRAHSHLGVDHLFLNHGNDGHIRENRGVVADALALPFADGAFDLVSCGLFAHHLDSQQLALFVRESLRVSRRAVLINDLIRHPLHLALVYVSFPLMNNRVAWLDGLTSVRRAYVPDEIQNVISSAFSPETAVRMEISRNYLFRMGLILWKAQTSSAAAPREAILSSSRNCSPPT
jgi:ubiquinone/menaquinone biosynthesis C-methylase UbiE